MIYLSSGFPTGRTDGHVPLCCPCVVDRTVKLQTCLLFFSHLGCLVSSTTLFPKYPAPNFLLPTLLHNALLTSKSSKTMTNNHSIYSPLQTLHKTFRHFMNVHNMQFYFLGKMVQSGPAARKSLNSSNPHLTDTAEEDKPASLTPCLIHRPRSQSVLRTSFSHPLL